jgi:hypothetical protein
MMAHNNLSPSIGVSLSIRQKTIRRGRSYSSRHVGPRTGLARRTCRDGPACTYVRACPRSSLPPSCPLAHDCTSSLYVYVFDRHVRTSKEDTCTGSPEQIPVASSVHTAAACIIGLGIPSPTTTVTCDANKHLAASCPYRFSFERNCKKSSSFGSSQHADNMRHLTRLS